MTSGTGQSSNEVNVTLNLGTTDCDWLQVEGSQPVMVFFHGGGFSSGTGNTSFCGPDFFMEENVVLVSVNYRCGSFGKYLQ